MLPIIGDNRQLQVDFHAHDGQCQEDRFSNTCVSSWGGYGMEGVNWGDVIARYDIVIGTDGCNPVS